MPRRKIKLDDPDDPQKTVEYIEAKARQAESKAISILLTDKSKPIVLEPMLRQRRAGSTFEITSYAQKVASASHLRGEVAQNPCNNCQQGRGPFLDCVQLSGYGHLTKSCCSNCQFDLNTSKHHSPNELCNFAAGLCYTFYTSRGFWKYTNYMYQIVPTSLGWFKTNGHTPPTAPWLNLTITLWSRHYTLPTAPNPIVSRS